ncbi:hypothetical protein ACJMK2_027939 [Sinanodonta woodiana]|uniref:E3 ubiquitin-protein ligase rnf213-alpha-like n=1 Tax=Sinanodonta woodiana TaxID=1069815 RepID=A0ABD3X5I3_SINWO
MKCRKCELELCEGHEFCYECGTYVVETIVILCSGRRKDGSLCGAELQEKYKYCTKCGTKVDQSVFQKKQTQCSFLKRDGSSCGNLLNDADDFCLECGTQRGTASTTSGNTVLFDSDAKNDGGNIDGIKAKQTSAVGSEISSATIVQRNSLVFGITSQLDGEVWKEDYALFQDTSMDENSTVLESHVDKENTGHSPSSGSSDPFSINDLKDEEANYVYNGKSASRNSVDLENNLSIVTLSEQKDDDFIEDHSDDNGENKCIDYSSLDSTDSELPEDEVTMPASQECVAASEQIMASSKHKKKKKKHKIKRDRKKKKMENMKKGSDESSEQLQEHKIKMEIGENSRSDGQPAKSQVSDLQFLQESIMADDSSVVLVSLVGASLSQKEEDDGKSSAQRKQNGDEATTSDVDEMSREGINEDHVVDRNTNHDQAPIQESGISQDPHSSVSNLKKSYAQIVETGQNQHGDILNIDPNKNEVENEIPGQKPEMDRKALKDAENNQQNPNGPESSNEENNKSSTNDGSQNTSSRRVAAEGKSTGNHANQRTNVESVMVHFHALLSPEFDLTPTDVVMIQFHDEFSGWDSKRHKHSFVRKTDDHYTEFSLELEIPKKAIFKDKKMQYKYVIVKDKSMKNKDDKYIWEHYHADGQGHTNRSLHLPDKMKNMAIWHQYDGVVFPKLNEGFLDRVKSMLPEKVKKYLSGDVKERVKQDLCQSLQYFMPKFFNDLQIEQLPAMPVNEALTQLEELLYALRRVYFVDRRCYTHMPEFEQKVSDFILAPVLRLFEKVPLYNWKESPAESEIRMLRATVALSALNFFHLELKLEQRELLAQGLLVRPNHETRICHDLDWVNKSFPQVKKRQLSDHLISFINSMSTVKSPAIFCCIPFHHFLTNALHPFDKIPEDYSHDHKSPKWWGVAALSEAVGRFKNILSSKWTMKLEEVVSLLHPHFEMDYLLPRTFMAMLNLDEIGDAIKTGKIPFEICAASLTYYVKITLPAISVSSATYEVKKVCDAVLELEKLCRAVKITTDERSRLDLIQPRMVYKIASHLLNETLGSRYQLLVSGAAQTFIYAVTIYDQIHQSLKLEQPNTRQESEHFKFLSRMYDGVKIWLGFYLHSWDLYREDHLRCWDSMFAPVDLQSEAVRDAWNFQAEKDLHDTLREWMQYYTFVTWLIDIYCRKVDTFHPSVQNCLSQLAFKAIETGYNIQMLQLHDHERVRFGILLSSLFTRGWDAAVKNGDEENRIILHHILNWTPFAYFLKMISGDESNQRLLSPDCFKRLNYVSCLVKQTAHALANGTITLNDLVAIKAAEDKFQELVSIIPETSEEEKWKTLNIARVVNIRCREVESYLTQKTHITTLVHLCQNIQSVQLTELDGTMKDLEGKTDLCIKDICLPANVETTLDRFHPQITAFKLSAEVISMLEPLHASFKSNIFLSLWREVGYSSKVTTIEEVYEKVWKPVSSKMEEITQKIFSGEILFNEIELYIGKNDNEEKMVEEMMLINVSDVKARERVKQLKQYRQLEACVDGAKTVLTVAIEYELSGDFEVIETIASQGLKELRVFVDLASRSAGEGAMEIDKVNCLHAATMGYAPLIFDLAETSGYRELLDKCKILWKDLKADPNLPRKLHDTNRNLEWLKTVKQAHGSVEVTSLAQAKAISSKGIFRVGALNTIKNITKGMVFDSLRRLANVFIKLNSAGCILFKHWQTKFLCDPTRPVCAFIEFGQGAKSLKGRRTKTDDVTAVIPKIAKFMENCLEKWIGHINQKRSEYLELNYFTTDQLVILQQELVKVGPGQITDIKIYPILSSVKENCTYEDLVDAMRKASDDMEVVQTEVDGEHMETENEDDGEAALNETKKDKIQKFIVEMVKSGFSEKLAKVALGHVDPDQITEGIIWCNDHLEEEAAFKEEDTQMVLGEHPSKEAIIYEGWKKSCHSSMSLTAAIINRLEEADGNMDVDPLIDDLEKLWEEFLTSVSSSVTDYLSVEHLGLILRRLAEKDHRKIDRPFPSGFQLGTPNLIICPKADVLPTVLSIYMMDHNQPLPYADEVLMCTRQTTLDQVNFQYRLIVVCSAENEYKSRIITALDRFRRPPLPIPDICHIVDYVKRKLKVKGENTASSVDFDSSSVRVVRSWRAGVGKSLYVKRRNEKLAQENPSYIMTDLVNIPLQEKEINVSDVTEILLTHILPPGVTTPRIFHLDIAHEVQEGVDYFLFNLLILGCLTDKSGYIWRRSPRDLYLIETMPIGDSVTYIHHVFDFLPFITCRSPLEILDILTRRLKPKDFKEEDPQFDLEEFTGQTFQRPYQYLSRFDQRQRFDDVDSSVPWGTPADCLKVLLRHCGVPDPSWAEFHHFVWFLNTQLRDFEKSNFCSATVAEDLPGFSTFVLRFLIQMSRDFSTRSLLMSEESPTTMMVLDQEDDKEMEDSDEEGLAQYQMRRTWESSPHPYLFFNPDGHTITFLGFNIERSTGNLIDQQTKQVLETAILPKKLYDSLVRNRVPIQEDFDSLPRERKIERLCLVMGNEMPHDPDNTYELTTDNVKKILAIYMRFRCDIPVIIMGETGCGKTRLVKFLCALQTPPGTDVKNMILMKVHGGTTIADIKRKVEEARKTAQENTVQYGPHMYTVLFFDEANTTEAIGMIKEIMCDRSMEGNHLDKCQNLKFVAACNPYKKHSEALIKRLEQAGLGYHVDSNKTTDRLGRVPMRRLVYRVQPLPLSLLPLVWDFGQLNTQIEDLYIRQMVRRYIRNEELPNIPGLVEVISGVLTASQDFMRQQKDECSFVSLRDVERVLNVMSWLYAQSKEERTLFDMMDEIKPFYSDDEGNIEEESAYEAEEMLNAQVRNQDHDDVTRSLVLALGVCYHACLKNREEYRRHVAQFFKAPCNLPRGPDQIEQEISICQDVFLENVQLEKNIARNTALKENVFMMVISIELRIPLFLVGKPGSSKSLAKTIVSDAMQGNAAHKVLFTEFKQVAFIGISNWALDPAKMNRGILVQREVPDLEELVNTAEGICGTMNHVYQHVQAFIEPLAISYLELFGEASVKREFFGLRDFYSLMKMIYSFVEQTNKPPTWHQLLHSIKRNFGGLDTINPVEAFAKRLNMVDRNAELREGDPDCKTASLIKACLYDVNNTQSESRYLLLLTENYGALTILQQLITTNNIITIFGSSFPKDQEYTQVCRNINRIKVCMETGKTVVLLNLENLYESLYDALNQYYVYFGGERYVDLGLGTHRVKCRVHKKFRLIVVAEKDVVYKKFPIPLINRLEKHFLTVNTILTREQSQLAEELEKWVKDFCTENEAKKLLLWCATPDSVVRIERCNLAQQEKIKMKPVYMREQCHENLAQYLHFKLETEKIHELFAQITTHSKLLSTADKSDIHQAVGILPERIALETLQSFDTEQQFSRKIRYLLESNPEEELLLMIQSDSGDTSANLVASARYCVLDEHQQLKNRRTAPCHVIFIIQLPRIAGGCFTGFQCGLWHSAHVDDLRAQVEDMPSIWDMLGKSVGFLMERAVGTKPAYLDMEEMLSANTFDFGSLTLETNVMDTERKDTEVPRQVKTKEMDWDGEEAEKHLGDPELQDDTNERTDHKLNVHSLILSCIQPALVMVKDKEETSDRSTRRIELMLDLLHQKPIDDLPTFLHGLSCHIAALLKEREKSSFRADFWMSNEAAKPENINKAGTFRRACFQYLESKISPILAGIIAHIDTNHNLDIIRSHITSGDWKARLWLQILNTPGAIQLQYSDLQSPTRLHELNEVIIKTTGCEGQMFTAVMPFSWLIYEQIDGIWKTAQGDQEEEDVHMQMERVIGLLEETKLGPLLETLESEVSSDDICCLYAEDFTHMVYHAHSTVEHELVHKAIMQTSAILLEDTSPSILARLVSIHESHNKIVQHFRYFRSINQVWPECAAAIRTMLEENPNHFLLASDQFTLAVLGLHLLIEQLEPPNAQYLNNADSHQEWLQKICNYRPVIEKGLVLYSSDSGTRVDRAVVHAKEMWTRITVVKLCIEHMMTSEKEAEKHGLKNVMPLWMMLGDFPDLKDLQSLENVEKFLKMSNRAAMKELLGQEQTCSYCEDNIEGAPVVMPCKDIICIKCYHEVEALGTKKCPKCSKDIPNKFNPEATGNERKAVQKFKEYQSRCNSFFMDVVSQLCFDGNTAPSDQVVDKLLGYITMTAPTERQGKMKTRKLTKELTIFNDCVDPNPVFRSFLLQLLLRTSEKKVLSNLEKYFSQAHVVIGEDNIDIETHMVQLWQLVVQCLEDSFYLDCTKEDEVALATGHLIDAEYDIKTSPSKLQRLYGIAKARFGLAITAKHIHETVLKKGQIITQQQRRLIDHAASLCEGDCKWPKIYFIKYLCRCYGVDSYQAMCKNNVVRYLRWIKYQPVEERDKVREVSDRYIVCGPHYVNIREAVTKVVLGEGTDQLDKAMKDTKMPENKKEILLCLALHREVTMSRLQKEHKIKATPEAIDMLQKYCSEADFMKNKEVAQKIIQNAYGVQSPILTVTPDLDLKQQGVLCLLMHCDLVLRNLQGDRTLAEPLIRLATRPQTMQDAFIPTMPQDDVQAIREVMMVNRGEDNPVFYRCPNGHPYIIGECGRPYTVSKCPKCGSEIGGQLHVPRPGNVLDPGVDCTETGHILGHAENRTQLGPERSLTAVYCGIIRLLTHLIMLLGTNIDSLAVSKFIKPDITEDMVPQFLWQHIEHDLVDLHRTLGKSLDDVFIIMHSILSSMVERHRDNERIGEEMCELTSKVARHDWEKKFSEKFVVPTLQRMENLLIECNTQLVKDKRLGSDPLLCLLYEINQPQEKTHFEMLQENPAMWRFRSQITMDHLRHEFDVRIMGTKKTQMQHPVLQLFLKEDHHLRAIRYLPSILKLQRILFQKYQRKLDRAEASTITVEMLRKESDGDELPKLLDEYAEVWDLVRENLVFVPKEYRRCRIGVSTPVSQLLPTASDAGQCAYSVLEFLFRKQNDFLDNYYQKAKRRVAEIPHVKVRDITPAHLISYHPEQDILPLVLANCNYSFAVGNGTTIEYNFANLERQIVDRFLFGKCFIDIEIELMVYRAEYTNATVFRKLQEKIPQESLSIGVKHKISEEFRSLPDLCQALDNLDIAISFLKSIGGNPGNNIDKFMVETLKMEQSLYSPKAKQICQYQHAKSLWLLLSLEKTKQLALHKQVIFDGLPEQFHQQLSAELVQQVMAYLQPLALERLGLLLDLMFECIILVISLPQNPDDEDYVDAKEKKFKDYMFALMTEKDPEFHVAGLDSFPDDVLSKFCVATWTLTYQCLEQKKRQRY